MNINFYSEVEFLTNHKHVPNQEKDHSLNPKNHKPNQTTNETDQTFTVKLYLVKTVSEKRFGPCEFRLELYVSKKDILALECVLKIIQIHVKKCYGRKP